VLTVSVITDIILVCDMDDEALVCERLPIAGKPIDRKSLTGGDKVFCTIVFAWAKNYLDRDEFFREVEAVPWEAPSSVMLLVTHEEEVCPAVYRLGETDVYSHTDEHECMLGEYSLDDGERLNPPPKLVRAVRARAG
jgi:hypothetical protein